jgi:hypothetical protein
MNNNDDDYYERQSELLEQFLSKNDKGAFMKMLNMNINTSSDKEKEQKRHPNFMKSMKNKSPQRYYDYFHMKQPSYNNNDLFSYHNHDYKDNQINDFKIDFHNIIQDPQYKDKSMKGNYKWGSMKFNMIKLNLAKRRGIPIENFQMRKIAGRSASQMEKNGQFVMNNNPLTLSKRYEKYENFEKRVPGGIRNSLKAKMGMMGKVNQETLIKRQMTQEMKTNVHDNEINKLDINL